MYSRLYLVKTKTKCFVVLADTLKTVSSFIDGGLEEGGGSGGLQGDSTTCVREHSRGEII